MITNGSHPSYMDPTRPKTPAQPLLIRLRNSPDPHLLPAWYAFRDSRAKRRAVEWLADNSLIDDDSAGSFLTDHPDPELP
jgi:hypothetical protein